MTTREWWNSLSVRERVDWLRERYMNLEIAEKSFDELSEFMQEHLIIRRNAGR